MEMNLKDPVTRQYRDNGKINYESMKLYFFL